MEVIPLTLDAIVGDVDRDQLSRVLDDEATVADAIALWDALENPWEIVDPDNWREHENLEALRDD
jgi:hypothetical protein